MDGFGEALARAMGLLVIGAFVAGGAVVGLLVWVWPYLPSIRLAWGE